MKKRIKNIISVALAMSLLGGATLSADASSGYAYSMGGYYGSTDSVRVINTANNWARCGYKSYYKTEITYSFLSSSNMLNSDILYFSAFGNQNFVKLQTNVYLVNGSSNGSNEVGISDYTLSNTRLVVYDAGYTASGTSNLCTATISRGADAVIGWYGSVNRDDTEKWQSRFQSYCVSGYKLVAAITYADSFSDYNNNTSVKDHRIYGNYNQVIQKSSASSVSILSEDTICAELETTPDRVVDIDEIECTYDDIDYNAINSEIKENFPDFDESDYKVTTVSNSLDGNSFVVDYTLKIGDYTTDSGYTIIFRDNKASTLYNNTIQSNTVSTMAESVSEVNSSDEMETYKNAALNEAQKVVTEMNNGSFVVSQTAEPYYDINTNSYYYRVITEYDHMNSDCYDSFVTLYPIS